jgi:C_GCAxxG_C_C family probable redox protein
MARMGEQCGAVTGAFMVIGLKYGKTKAKDDGARDKTYGLAREFVARFQSRHGSIICKELLGYDLSNPKEGETAKEKGLFVTLCPHFIRTAAEILEEIL